MGAPAPSEHGTAVASLAVGKGFVRGAVPGAPLLVADVYGRDPRGGNALAISRALGFLAQRRVKVIAMSLVGPPNSLVARAIGEAMARGIHVVAAVGNDGPAAPSAFPASYDGVIAVTGVDGRNRPLIEAGRSLHLDFAAPGADMAAASASGGIRAVRGTSYAVPLVAGRIARSTLADVRAAATDLGPRGPDRTFGYGLVCGDCRTRPPKK
jgi:subtilisin family serine protease